MLKTFLEENISPISITARHVCNFRSDKYVETVDGGLVILAASTGDAGRYDCQYGSAVLSTYNITVDPNRCNAPSKTQDYQKVYSDWCHEFEKYKLAMKTWEKKQAVS